MRTPTWQLEDISNTEAQLPCDFWAEYEYVPSKMSLDIWTITDIHCHTESTGVLPWDIFVAIRDWWDDYGPEFVQKWVRKEAQAREDD